MTDNVIEINNLTRDYVSATGFFKKKTVTTNALKGIDFCVKKNEIFGLIGPNGAGKSTTLNILSTLLAPTSGSAKVLGFNTFGEEKKLRHRINFIRGGERCLYWRLSAEDNLKYFSDLYKIPKDVQNKRIPELLKLVGLYEKKDYKVETYSKGMKQKLQIARGLINDPEVLFLDEPTIGLDPVSAMEFRELVKSLKAMGKTIILTTHYMHDVELLCDRIAIINHGKLIVCDTISNLKKEGNGTNTVEFECYKNNRIIFDRIRQLEYIDTATILTREGREILSLQTKEPEVLIAEIKKSIEEDSRSQIQHRESTLEDIYVKLIQSERP